MLALIDLDPLLYRYGNCTFPDTGEPMPDHMIKRMVDERIEEIVTETEADDWIGYISGPNNFRYDIATILPYKGNRAGLEKPAKYQMVKDYLLSNPKVELVDGYEADDAMSIAQYGELNAMLDSDSDSPEAYTTIICTVDKDLLMVPGYHFNYNTNTTSFVTEIEGLRFFYKQLLTGDPVDNIKGLYGVGKSSKLLKDIDELETEEDMYNLVKEQYVKRFGSYADQFLLENARLLWMLRTTDDEWSPIDG